jgi:uncharacterized protein
MVKLDKTKRENLTFEIREVLTNSVDNTVKIGGYAAVFDKPSDILWGSFVERIRPGAFKKTITEMDQVMLWDHNSQYVLGRRSNGTLTLEEDEIGLRFECIMPDTSYARDCQELIKRGDVKQMSFGFNVIREDWQDIEKPIQRRDLLEIRLFEVSIVTFPAYAETSVSLRSLNSEQMEKVNEFIRSIQQPAEKVAEPEKPADLAASPEWIRSQIDSLFVELYAASCGNFIKEGTK